ncbi:hypothetical protein Tco_1000328, partial [Tanacetum coccineum]
EDEDPKEEEFEEEKEPQEEEDDMKYILRKMIMKPEDVIEVEDTVKSEDKTVPASVHKVVKSRIKASTRLHQQYFQEKSTAVSESTVELLH